MAVLIERTYTSEDVWSGKDLEEVGKVTATVLPSGKVLSAEGADIEAIKVYAAEFGPEGMNLPEEDFFRRVADIHRVPTVGDFWIYEDPQEARQIIQEAGLREAGQKEAPSGAEIAKMLEEKGLK